MTYEHLGSLQGLLNDKLITMRKHPTRDLVVYNYTAFAQSLKIHEWSPALCDCRGLILDGAGRVVGRPFRKFWNYDQVSDKIPNLPFTVWEKLDGSLGIICNHRGKLVVSTRGSFESYQAKWAEKWLEEKLPGWVPMAGLTYLVEIIYPENRIVVDYGGAQTLKLLAVMEADGTENLAMFYAEKWDKARGLPPNTLSSAIGPDPLNEPNKEGYVVRWANGFRAKIKFAEYVRVHRLITQVSTRSIWELLRAGKSTQELVDRVPWDFKKWVTGEIDRQLIGHAHIEITARLAFSKAGPFSTRKSYAEWAKKQQFPGVLFALYDGKPIEDPIWKMVEPRSLSPGATPFRREFGND